VSIQRIFPTLKINYLCNVKHFYFLKRLGTYVYLTQYKLNTYVSQNIYYLQEIEIIIYLKTYLKQVGKSSLTIKLTLLLKSIKKTLD